MNLFLQLKRALLAFLLMAGLCSAALGQTIKGKIFDSKTGEPLTGATVKIEKGDFKKSLSTRLDGSYSFAVNGAGTYQLKVDFIGYEQSQAYQVTVKSGSDIAVQDVFLKDLSTQLNEVAITGQGSKVSDGSARGLEKNANSVVNILSQNAIQLLPDVTLGNTIQRVSGVTIQRTSTGEGRYAIVWCYPR